jgi:hypothetical protein
MRVASRRRIVKSEIALHDIMNSDTWSSHAFTVLRPGRADSTPQAGDGCVGFLEADPLLAAAESGRISRAAVELNVSQSAVTAAVQQLERGH